MGRGVIFVGWGTAPPFSDPLGWCACTDLLNTYYWVMKIMFSEKFAENQRTFVGVRTETHTPTHTYPHPLGVVIEKERKHKREREREKWEKERKK